MAFALNGLQKAVARYGRGFAIPLWKTATGGESPSVKEIKARVAPAIRGSGGAIYVDARGGQDQKSAVWTENILPKSIEMLTTNQIPVQPSLLLKTLPWDTLLSTTIKGTPSTESLLQDIRKLYEDLRRWKDLGHLVNPQLAIEICKKASTWMSLREMDRLMEQTPSGPLGLIQDAMANNNMELSRLAERHERIAELLKQNKVSEAYDRAQAALRSLESVHNLLENARMRALEAQRDTAFRKAMLWAASGTCVVLGLACEFLAALPGDLPSVLPALRDAIATGAVLCLSFASYVQLTSEDFGAYMAKFRDAQDARIRLRLRLEEDINACLDQGFSARG